MPMRIYVRYVFEKWFDGRLFNPVGIEGVGSDRDRWFPTSLFELPPSPLWAMAGQDDGTRKTTGCCIGFRRNRTYTGLLMFKPCGFEGLG
jgi:hypothetical protein